MQNCHTIRRAFYRNFGLVFVVLVALGGDLFPSSLAAQTPLALPNTITTIAGGAASSPGVGTACAAGSPYTSVDSLGDGCPATLVALGADQRGGVGADNFGNIFLLDYSNNALRMIDPRSGLITLVAGKGTACSSKTDNGGDGCVAATQTVLNNPRGMAVDPYGNILIAGYSSNFVNVVCRAVSPLCVAAQVGKMYRIAGYAASASSGGTAVTGTTAGSAGDGAVAFSSTATNGVNGPRGVAADQYGNVYIGDTGNSRYRVVVGPASYNGVTNPLAGLIALNPGYSSVNATTAAGMIYPLAGGFTTPTAGNYCNGVSGAKALDSFGNGCPYFYSTVGGGVGGAVQGVAVDAAGDIVLSDAGNSHVRVIYMGGTQMANLILANNQGNAAWVDTPTSLNVGSVYLLAGRGSTSVGATPTLGSKTSLSGSLYKITLDGQGNIYVGDNGRVDFIDGSTGYVRALFASGSVCIAATDAIGDGCPASQSSFSGANGLGLALDDLGNLYMADAGNIRVRKVSAASLIPTTLGVTTNQTIKVHLPVAASVSTGMIASFATSSAEITSGSVACGTGNADNTLDCSVPIAFAPVAPGTRSATLTVTPTSGSGNGTPANLIVSGAGLGSALAVDSTATGSSTLGSGLRPQSVALDGAGNVYTMDGNASTVTLINPGGAMTRLPSGLPANPSQVVVDTQGNVYAVGAGTSTISKFTLTGPASWTSGSVSYAPPITPAQPQAIAVDSNNTIYVYDQANAAIYKIAQGFPLQPLTTLATGFTNVVALALDPNGNLYVADKGAQHVYKITQAGVQTTIGTSAPVTPVGVAADVAGNLFVQDAASGSVFQISVSGPGTGSPSNQTTVLAGLSSPNGIALDGSGNLYSSDAVNQGIVKVLRSQVSFDFGTNIATVLPATLTNAGNTIAMGYAQSDASDFQVAAGATNGCSLGSTAIAAGYACTITASFAPSGSGTGVVTDAVTLAPVASSTGALILGGTKTGTAVTTTTVISGQTPLSPVYAASGTEVSFTVTVTPSSGSVSGTNVQVTVDGGSPVTYVLAGSSVAVTLSGLTAGSHTISATYATQSGIVGSSSPAAAFAIAQLGTSVSWTPASTTVQVSQPIGSSVLNAISGIAGLYAYTATPSGGASMIVDASTYLPIGTYALGVTFTPTDAVDYGSSTGSIGTFTVTKASTTAGLGATQNLVAADGSGNYTSVQAAVNALSPTAGGTVYIAPGTYSGFVTVNTPFVSLRGLGGNPGNVILTNEDGAFSAPFLPGQGAGNGGASGDQGSSTMVVAKGTVNGTSYTPNAFYMENLTVANTYDTDSTNSNTNATVGGVCTAGQPANNNQALFNAGTLCNSQALALWITSDQAVLNNVQLTSLQDTLYAGSQGCGAPCQAARQYFWKGRINGDVDYIFGDAAMVFDHTVFYTAYHSTATGTTTIEAQNKKAQTNSSSDYLSGYVMNHAYLLSQSSGMTNLYYGRPYGQYSTHVMLNSFVDQVNATGWIEFSGDTNLPTSTYAEFNTSAYADPATGSADPNGFIYAGSGGSSGSGVTGTRETVSTNPGTVEAANAIRTSLTAAQAAQYYPIAFLSTPVPTPSPVFSGFVNSWDPTAALAAGVNAFVPAGSSITINPNASVTILVRPQTPGGGVIPTGTYTILDGSKTLASGTLDASGEVYFTTSGLGSGVHNITTTYSGDANFSGSSSSAPYVITVNSLPATATTLGVSATSVTLGTSVTLTATVSAASGTPTGTVVFTVGSTTLGSVALPANGIATLPTSNLPVGTDSVLATYSGDANFAGSSNTITVTVISQLDFNVPSLTFATQADGTTSLPSTVTLTNDTGVSIANIAIAAPTGFTINSNTCPATFAAGQSCSFNVLFTPLSGQVGTVSGNVTASGGGFTGSIPVSGTAVIPTSAPAVATGDTRTVTEPSFPAACQKLTASFHDANEDVPLSVEAVSTNLDQARLQAALNACTGTNQAVQLSMDSAGNNAFLTGPITIPSGVTLLVDPGVTLYFSRNAQDYDTVQGTHTCGTVNAASNTASCQNLISITNANNAGIMGYGKLNGRGGAVVLNSFPTPGYQGTTVGESWWNIANDAGALGGSQQNPRGIQISKSTNITLYKITFKNAPNFHIAISSVKGLTVWGIKIITPYSAHNTDGIDPSGTVNATITNSWISDGDDNIAVGGSGAASANISVVNNHFFAGHGESIGSITTNGVSNVLFDNNAMYGDADVDGSNSTGIRIKSANDRGGLVQNIQYSNSCFANHGTQIQFTPVYNTNAGTLTPNFKNILLQNLRFSNQGAVATGSVQFLGANNNGTINPLIVTLDNVTMDTLSASNLTAPANAQITFGPGQVSNTLTSLLLPYNGTNGNTILDNRTQSSLVPPACSFTFLVPELTSSTGANQTVTAGQYPTAVVILSPAFSSASYPYPTGTVTLTDEANRTFTATLSGSGDTVFIPITNAPAGTHTYIASYSGNAQYAAIPSFGSLTVTVNPGSLPATSVGLSGVPASTTYGAGFTATATVAGSSPSGSVLFLVNGGTYATVPLSGGTAAYTFNLPLGSYTISAVYGGDGANAGSTSASSAISVAGALTSTSLAISASTTIVGSPVALTATVTSVAGIPAGTVSFSYTTASNTTPTVIGSATLTNGVANYSALLPQGTDNVTASYVASGNFGSSASNSQTITVNAAPIIPVSAAPVPLPYTISTLVGGAASSSVNTTCTGHLDAFGDGCLGTAIQLAGGTAEDLRGVTADPFGNVYFTDANAAMVRKVSPNGIVTSFAGYISGTACVATSTVGCTPTLVKLTGKPRGIYSDSLGNIFIAGYGDNKVQVVKVTDGKMYLVAGTGSAPTNTADSAGDGGLATSALLKGPRSIATDVAGNIYIADSGDNRIREVLNPASGLAGAGNIQTVAGTGTTSSTGDGSLATLATLSNPQGVLVDSNANIYIAESSKVRAVCVTCAPGSMLYNLLNRLGVAAPVNGNIYTIAGTSSSSNPTLKGGLANTVNMAPQKLAMDIDGNLYIADSSNNVVWFEESRTGYVRVIAGGGTATSCAASAIGDGCAATQAIVGSNGGNGIGVALDLQGNLYISDSTNDRIRKVSNNLQFSAGAVGTPVSQTVQVHFVPGDSPTGTTLLSPEFSLSGASCTVNANDNTDDCTYPATFTPAVAGQRSAPLTVVTVLGNTGYFGFTGMGLGAGATLDPARQFLFGHNLTANVIATDTAGNVYVADGNSHAVLRYSPGGTGIGAGSSAAFTNLGTFANPSALAVDSVGNVYVADATTGLVTQISPAGMSKALGTGFTSPQGLALDALNNLYISDSATKTVTEMSSNLIGNRIIASANLLNPGGLALDSNNNVFVSDPSASAVYRYDARTLVRTTATTAATAPRSIAVDAAGNLLVADSASGSILAVPASANSASFTLATGVPGGTLALDSVGNVYTGSTTGQIVELLRTQGTATYNGASAAPSSFNLLSTGNAAASLTLNDPDTSNFKLTVNASTDCAGGSSPITIVAGGECSITSSFTPSARANYSNTVTFAGNAANAALGIPAGLQILQIGNNAPFPVTVQITGTTPASPTVNDVVTLTATVSSMGGTPTGSVVFSIDGTALAPASVVGGIVSANAGLLTAGTHQITAVFTSSDPDFASATAAPVSIAVSGVSFGTVQLVTTSVLSKLTDGSYQDAVTVKNTGTATATAVTITSLLAGSVNGSALPATLGPIAPGGASTNIVSIPASAGTSGSTIVVRVAGTYAGGTFGSSLRVKLP